MRLVWRITAALLALGAAAALLWRNNRAREEASRILGDTGAWLRAARLPIGAGDRAGRLRDFASQVIGPGGEPGVLERDDENLTITQRVRTNLGREPGLADVPHLNINTEARGIVYLRGYVRSEQQRQLAETVAASTEGVHGVVNELNIEQAVNL